MTSSPRKKSIVTKPREQGGHGLERGRRVVEDESCYGVLKIGYYLFLPIPF